jgi:cell cycle checkpoint protein
MAPAAPPRAALCGHPPPLRADAASRTAACGAAGAALPRPRAAPPRSSGIWADTHAPAAEADLAVAKKARAAAAARRPAAPSARRCSRERVPFLGPSARRHAPQKLEALRGWLQLQARAGGGVRGGRALVLSGPAGAGKSTAAQLLAAAAGFSVVHWTPPVPTLWAEHRHAGAGEYVSKVRRTVAAQLPRSCPCVDARTHTLAPQMDAFEAWLSRARLLAPLALAPPPPRRGGPEMPPPAAPGDVAHGGAAAAAPLAPPLKLLLLEDLPLSFGGGEGARARLLAALTSLAAASRFPAIVCLSDATGAEAAPGGGDRALSARDAIACLEEAGAAHIPFNAATKAEVAKALLRVAAAERVPLPQAAAAAIAEAARGDVRAAIGALQLRCAGGGGGGGGADAAGSKKRRKGAAGGAGGGGAGGAGGAAPAKADAAAWARDDTLSLFHALGKLLYNKRLPETPAAPAAPAAAPPGRPAPLALAPRFRRAPPEVTAPEAVLAQAGLTPGAALGFLHGAPRRCGAALAR